MTGDPDNSAHWPVNSKGRSLRNPRGARALSVYRWGATEDQVNMRGALPQRIDKRGSKLEEIAGTGQHDSRGG